MAQIIWDEIFITGNVPELTEKEICAKALGAWGNCSISKPPEKFGEAMAKIGQRLGIAPMPDKIIDYAKKKGYIK